MSSSRHAEKTAGTTLRPTIGISLPQPSYELLNTLLSVLPHGTLHDFLSDFILNIVKFQAKDIREQIELLAQIPEKREEAAQFRQTLENLLKMQYKKGAVF